MYTTYVEGIDSMAQPQLGAQTTLLEVSITAQAANVGLAYVAAQSACVGMSCLQ